MGLIQNVRPEFRLLANSSDITAVIRERFVSMVFTDESGMDSDLLEITLSDDKPEAPIQIPSAGAELELFLGYDGVTQRMGLFVFDELELSGEPGQMIIRARAAPYDKSKGGKANLQSQKTRSWPKGTKLAAMVAKIAKEHGMESAVSKSLQSIGLPHIDQADESDMNLLIRIAKKYDAVVKPAGGKLILAKRGESKTVSGADLPTVTILRTDQARWRMVQSKRESAGMVVAYWHAVKQAKRHEVKVGEGEPVRRLRQYYPTQEMALAAARAELSRRTRNQITLALTVPGRTDLAAEAKLKLSGWRAGVPTDWIITRVTHALDVSGYRCDLEAEQPNSDATPNVEDVAE